MIPITMRVGPDKNLLLQVLHGSFFSARAESDLVLVGLEIMIILLISRTILANR